MKFSAKLSRGCVMLLSGALCAAGLLLVGSSFAGSLQTTRAAMQARQSKEVYSIERGVLIAMQNYTAADLAYSGSMNYILASTVQSYAEQTADDTGAMALWLNGEYTLYSNLSPALGRSAQHAAVDGGAGQWRVAKADGKYYLLLSCPLALPSVSADLLCAYDVSSVFNTRNAQLLTWLAVTAALLAVGGAAASAFSRRLTAPLTALQETSGRIAAGDYASRTDIVTDDEIGALSRSFDAMAAAVEAQIDQMGATMQQQKDFIAAFTHEVKTPMTAMLGYADLMRAKPEDTALQQEAAAYIYHETRRLESLSTRLLALMGLEQDKDFAPVLALDRGLLAQVTRSLPQGSTPMPRVIASGCVVRVDRALWVDLLRNLTINAQRACKGIEGASVTLKCERQGEQAVFSVVDTGCGIPAADLPRVTEAFYMVDKSRTRADGGSGIGLALCSRIAAAHGTALHIESTEGSGTTVTVALPIAQPNDLTETEEPL